MRTVHERILSVLMANCAQPFAAGSPEGQLLVANAAFCELTGYTLDELLRLSWPADITPRERRDRQATAWSEHLATGRPIRYESEFVRRDGRRVPVEVLAHSLAGADGRPLYYYTFVSGVAVCRQAEATRLAEERLIAAFHANVQAMTIMTWPEARFVEVNEAWLRRTGFRTKDEVVGFTPVELGLPENDGAWKDFRRRLAAEGGVRDLEVRLRARSGELQTVLLSVEFVEIFGKQHLISSTVELGARKRSVATAREELALLADFSRVPADAAMIVDEDGTIVRFFGSTKVSTANPAGRKVDEVLPAPLAAGLVTIVAAVLRENEGRVTEFEVRLCDRERTIEAVMAPMRYRFRDRRTVAVYTRDITRLRAAENRLTFAAQLYKRSVFFNRLMADGLTGEYVAGELESYGIDTNADYCCYALQVADDGTQAGEGAAVARAMGKEDVVAWLVRKDPWWGWVWRSNGHVAMLVPVGRDNVTKESQVDFARQLIRDIERRFAFTRVTAGVATTDTGGGMPLDLRDLYGKAMEALLLCGSQHGGDAVHYADIGLYQVAFQLLKDSNVLALVQRTIGALSAYDRGHENNLLTTLERILEDENLRVVAEKLYVHHNTAIWRKKRIEKILGLSLDSFETRALVSLYLKVWILSGLSEKTEPLIVVTQQ